MQILKLNFLDNFFFNFAVLMLNLCQLLFLRQWSPFDHFEGRQGHSDWDKLPLNPHHCSDKILIRDILFNLCINPENGSNLNPICFCEREYAHTGRNEPVCIISFVQQEMIYDYALWDEKMLENLIKNYFHASSTSLIAGHSYR